MQRRSEAADGESVYGETSSREQGESVPRRTNPGNARVHHHLLDPSRSDLGLEFVRTMWWIMELKLLGGSGKTRKCELDAAEVDNQGAFYALSASCRTTICVLRLAVSLRPRSN